MVIEETIHMVNEEGGNSISADVITCKRCGNTSESRKWGFTEKGEDMSINEACGDVYPPLGTYGEGDKLKKGKARIVTCGNCLRTGPYLNIIQKSGLCVPCSKCKDDQELADIRRAFAYGFVKPGKKWRDVLAAHDFKENYIPPEAEHVAQAEVDALYPPDSPGNDTADAETFFTSTTTRTASKMPPIIIPIAEEDKEMVERFRAIAAKSRRSVEGELLHMMDCRVSE
jgi:hypothetical protein